MRVGIPEIGELIGSNLPGADEAKGTKVSQGVKNLWLIDGAIQRGLWYWMVAELSTDFLYEWATLLNESRFCALDRLSRALRTGDGTAVAAIQGWTDIQAEHLEWQFGAISAGPSAADLGDRQWNICISLKSVNTGILPHAHEIGIFLDPQGLFPVARSGPVQNLPGEEASMVVNGVLSGAHTVHILQRITVGFSNNSGTAHYYTGDTPKT